MTLTAYKNDKELKKKNKQKKLRGEDLGRQKALNFIVNTLGEYAEKHGLKMPIWK